MGGHRGGRQVNGVLNCREHVASANLGFSGRREERASHCSVVVIALLIGINACEGQREEAVSRDLDLTV